MTKRSPARGRARERAANQRALPGLEQSDSETLLLRTFWSPLPTWVYGTVGALLGALIGALVSLAGADTATAVLVSAAAGYLLAAVGWAVAGAVGGDLQEVAFSRRAGQASVRQALFWRWGGRWDLDLAHVTDLHLWDERGRLLNRFTPMYYLALTRDDGPPLRLGRYGTEREALALGEPLARFLRLRLQRRRLEAKA